MSHCRPAVLSLGAVVDEKQDFEDSTKQQCVDELALPQP